MATVSVHLGSGAGGTGGRFSTSVESFPASTSGAPSQRAARHYVVLDVVELGADRRERATVNLFLGAPELAELIDVARAALAELVDASVAAAIAEATAILDGPAHDGPAHDDEGGPYAELG